MTATQDREEIARAVESFRTLLAVVRTKLSKIVDVDELEAGKQQFTSFLTECESNVGVLARLAAKPADDGVRDLLKRAKRYGSFCDPECEGRCRECPDELIRDLAAALSTTGGSKG